VAAAKWLKQVMTDERLKEYLSRQGIKWQFNLSRAPWWGGQFERMVGVVKRSLEKTRGNGFLTWTELEKVILDVEVAVNDRPLSYVEDDVQLPILTPNTLLFGTQCTTRVGASSLGRQGLSQASKVSQAMQGGRLETMDGGVREGPA